MSMSTGAKTLLLKNTIHSKIRKVQGQVGAPPHFKTRVFIWPNSSLSRTSLLEAHTECSLCRSERSFSIPFSLPVKCNIPPWGGSSPIPPAGFIHTRNFNSVLGLTKWELCPHKATTTSQFTESDEISQFTGGNTNCQTGYLVPYRPNNAWLNWFAFQ